MKKKNGLIAISVITLVAVGFSAYIMLNSANEFEPIEPIEPINKIEQPIKSDFNGGSIRSGYLSPMYNRSYIASTYEEFEKYCEKNNNYAYDGQGNIVKDTGKLNPLIEKYDEKYFEQKSLALVYVQLGSGSNTVEFLGATKDGNNVKIHYQVVYPASGIGTCDMSGYIVFVEIDKDITNII